MTRDEAALVLSALRLGKGLLHPDEQREPLKSWYAEIAEAIAVQESFLAELQRAGNEDTRQQAKGRRARANEGTRDEAVRSVGSP